jgi:hypothetical protein
MLIMNRSTLTYLRLNLVLVAALVVVGVLAGVGPAFPRGVAAGTAWTFLATDAVGAAHALLGAVVLAGAVILVVIAPHKLMPALVVVGAGLSVASGIWYVQGQQPGPALTMMTLGWLISLIGSVVDLVRMRRRADARASRSEKTS